MTSETKKLIILNLPFVFVWYIADKLCYLYRISEGDMAVYKMVNAFSHLGNAFANPFPSIYPVDMLIGVIAALGLKIAVYLKGKNAKKFRQGVEYGSARWVA